MVSCDLAIKTGQTHAQRLTTTIDFVRSGDSRVVSRKEGIWEEQTVSVHCVLANYVLFEQKVVCTKQSLIQPPLEKLILADKEIYRNYCVEQNCFTWNIYMNEIAANLRHVGQSATSNSLVSKLRYLL